tara:strand:+ start:810 stop:1022 length:213 start_codon:yes stop_codon:yes gene_type:complete
MEMQPIEQVQAEAEAFFEREDVQAIFQEAIALATVKLPNYHLDKTCELKKDLSYVAFALNRRIKSIKIKD